MPRFDPLQNAFVAGELTPRLEGRDDIRQYAQGMRQSVNQIVLPQGAVMHRSGTQFESETKNSGPVILRPFEAGLDQAYILELGGDGVVSRGERHGIVNTHGSRRDYRGGFRRPQIQIRQRDG